MKSDPAYYRHERPELVACVEPATDNRVLDVGCGAGHVATRIKREGRAAVVWGIEVIAAAAEEARRNPALDNVVCGDLEQVIGDLPEAYFSHLICGDVLEHLVDPWRTLAGLRKKLRPGGRVICSLPNVRNLSFVAMLVFEASFRYRESGVMDRTHLRWFCRKDARALFEQAGFVDVRIGPVRPKPTLRNRLSRALLRDWGTKGFLITGENPR
jgi:2-polyprenyl-3-methyl-5-hydroxy-6-metoxy-1,4-benzoquinol methylase